MIKSIGNNFDSILSNISLTLNNKKYLILVCILSLIFIGVAYFTYNKYIKNSLKTNYDENNEYLTDDTKSEDKIMILYFYTEWCPYCKKADPEINKFQKHIDNINSVHNDKINLIKIDCDKNPSSADQYKIDGYPSIKLVYKKTIYDYDAKPNKDNLIQFLESTTGIS